MAHVKVQLSIYPEGDEHAIEVHESELANLRHQGLIRVGKDGKELVTEVPDEAAKPAAAPEGPGAKPTATTPPAVVGAAPKEKP